MKILSHSLSHFTDKLVWRSRCEYTITLCYNHYHMCPPEYLWRIRWRPSPNVSIQIYCPQHGRISSIRRVHKSQWYSVVWTRVWAWVDQLNNLTATLELQICLEVSLYRLTLSGIFTSVWRRSFHCINVTVLLFSSLDIIWIQLVLQCISRFIVVRQLLGK